MAELQIDWESDERQEHHVIAATAAMFLSTALHIAGIVWLIHSQFQLPILWSEVTDARRRPIHLEEVTTDVSKSSEVLDADEGVWAQKFGTPEELAEEAKSLGLFPDEVAIEPAALAEDSLAGESGNTVSPSEFPESTAWAPRQEIMMIENRLVADEVPISKRKVVPVVDRVSAAPDMSLSSKPPALDEGVQAQVSVFQDRAPTIMIGEPTLVAGGGLPDGVSEEPALQVEEPSGQGGAELFEETPTEVTDIRPIETLLKASVTRYSGLLDMKYGYFKVEVNRAAEDVLPPTPKDVVIVQDSSNSMTEQRLYFCRNGLTRCLKLVGPKDRFNVVSFQNKAKFCFPDWQKNTPEALAKASIFSATLASGGNTDIYASLREIFRLKQTPGRPMIVFLITDGRSTAGITDSSDIIGEITKLNNGLLSIYTMGTITTANTYLLDLLSYCNRGESVVVTRGRWDIPDAMENVMKQVSRPVLTDVRFRMTDRSVFEVYPVLTSNLYLDRPLVLYGRYPKDNEQLVFQAVGQSGDTKCDMLFDLNLAWGLKSRDKTIREEWARQKIYHLIGLYTRNATPEVLEEIRKTAKTYRVRIPYKEEVGL
jgi:hypothetical protein